MKFFPAMLSAMLLLPVLSPAQTNHSFAIVIGETPVITDNDIVEYRFAEHAMVIKSDALKRLALARPKSLAGTEFRVLADGVSVYSGLIVPGSSSMTYDRPTIWLGGWSGDDTATVYIHGPHFQEPRFQKGNDPRGDVRITTALGALGKLKPGNPGSVEDKQAFTERVATILSECEQIKPGKTREDLLKAFTTEGGLSTAEQRTYAHKSCPYIKIDVQFSLSGTNQSITTELPTDRITHVSKPYLTWSIMD